MQKLGAGQSLACPGGMDRSSLGFWNMYRLSNSQVQRDVISHVRVLGLDSKETPENVCRLQRARTRPRCCELHLNACNLGVHNKYLNNVEKINKKLIFSFGLIGWVKVIKSFDDQSHQIIFSCPLSGQNQTNVPIPRRVVRSIL